MVIRMIEMIDYSWIVNSNNVGVDLVGCAKDTFV
jgi:hypothetical protein